MQPSMILTTSFYPSSMITVLNHDRLEVPSPYWFLVAWAWCPTTRSWRGAESLAGGAEGDGGERQELQLLRKMSEWNIWGLYVGGGFVEYDRFPQLMARWGFQTSNSKETMSSFITFTFCFRSFLFVCFWEGCLVLEKESDDLKVLAMCVNKFQK